MYYTEKLFVGLKGYKTPIFSLRTISLLFPEMLANILKLFTIKDESLAAAPMNFDWAALKKFQMEMGNVIYNENFDKLDDIILTFFNTYHCVKPLRTTIGKWFIRFPEESINTFVEICNDFKGKSWNDIIEPFLDSLHELFSQASISMRNT